MFVLMLECKGNKISRISRTVTYNLRENVIYLTFGTATAHLLMHHHDSQHRRAADFC